MDVFFLAAMTLDFWLTFDGLESLIDGMFSDRAQWPALGTCLEFASSHDIEEKNHKHDTLPHTHRTKKIFYIFFKQNWCIFGGPPSPTTYGFPTCHFLGQLSTVEFRGFLRVAKVHGYYSDSDAWELLRLRPTLVGTMFPRGPPGGYL